MTKLSAQIENVAKQPLQGRLDGIQFRQHSLKDLVEADNHLESAAAVVAAQSATDASRKIPGLGQFKIVPI